MIAAYVNNSAGINNTYACVLA